MRLGFDCYLFDYPEGSFIPRHKDPKKHGAQWRLNITLKKPREGGKFICEGPFYRWWRFTLFRADAYYHQVEKITDGRRWVLSFGFYPDKWLQFIKGI